MNTFVAAFVVTVAVGAVVIGAATAIIVYADDR